MADASAALPRAFAAGGRRSARWRRWTTRASSRARSCFRAITAPTPSFAPSGGTSRAGSKDAAGRRVGRAGHVLSQPAGRCRVESQARSRRGSSCSRMRRWPIRGTAVSTTTSARRARDSASRAPRRISTRAFVDDWSLARTGGRYVANDHRARIRVRPCVRAHASRCSLMATPDIRARARRRRRRATTTASRSSP